jgi:hypothetical protein
LHTPLHQILRDHDNLPSGAPIFVSPRVGYGVGQDVVLLDGRFASMVSSGHVVIRASDIRLRVLLGFNGQVEIRHSRRVRPAWPGSLPEPASNVIDAHRAIAKSVQQVHDLVAHAVLSSVLPSG